MIRIFLNAGRTVLAACLLVLPLAASALPKHSPYPGGIAVIDVGDAASAADIRFNKKRVLTVIENGRRYAIVGVPLDQSIGTASLTLADGSTVAFDVHEHGYREQHLTVAPGYVNPDPEASKRIAREQPLIASAIAGFSDAAPEGLQLAAPIPGSRSNSFGSRRFFNKEPRSPHRGMDISGGTGTPIHAPLAGTVVLADNFYFTGNAVFLDHGQGLISLYAHLDSIAVTQGDRVAQGELLGTVGATGRVTGAHLHFATYLNGTAVDPGLLLEPRE
jgi:murein DD-endopeptidase MepM/ murein hydrolase activator NlpD